ncbi:MAG: FecR family protein [Nanoarchaeota archaeon]|nr:FecR family protein [Nanoarchaeota archaeon]
MGKAKYIILGILGAILLLVIIGGAYAYMNFFKASPLAILIIDSGNVQYKTEMGDWKAASNNMKLNQGDSVKTLENSLTKIIFSDSVMRMDSSTEITIDNLNKESVSITQTIGRTWSRLLKISGISDYEVNTPNAIASVRGTGFAVIYDGNTTEIKVLDGLVNASGQNGESMGVGENKEAIIGDEKITLEDLKEDEWITSNKNFDEEHKKELKQEILNKYGKLINMIKSQYGLTDAELDDLFEQWVNGEVSVKQEIADGTIHSGLANLIPEQFKRY